MTQYLKRERFSVDNGINSIGAILIGIFVITLYAVVSGFIQTLAVKPNLQGENVLAVIGSLLSYAGFAYVLIYFIKRHNKKINYTPPNTYQHKFLLIGVLIYFTSIMANIFMSNATGIVPEVSKNQEAITLVMQQNTALLIWVVLSSCIFGPILEELVFRRIVIGEVNQSKVILAIRTAFSLIIFITLHVVNELSVMFAEPTAQNILLFIQVALPYIVLSLGFTFVYLKYQSIKASITAHIVCNSITTIFMLTRLL